MTDDFGGSTSSRSITILNAADRNDQPAVARLCHKYRDIRELRLNKLDDAIHPFSIRVDWRPFAVGDLFGVALQPIDTNLAM
jgi:hypothetical protein